MDIREFDAFTFYVGKTKEFQTEIRRYLQIGTHLFWFRRWNIDPKYYREARIMYSDVVYPEISKFLNDTVDEILGEDGRPKIYPGAGKF